MKKTVKMLFLLLFVVMVTLSVASCGKSNGSYLAGQDKFDGAPSGGMMGNGMANDVISSDRKIIKRVHESVQTEKYDDFLSSLREAINETGGYISSANHNGNSYYNSDGMRSSTLVIRIPAEKLADFNDKVTSLGIVYNYSETMDDVTASYVDIESRITVLEAEETALLEMLSLASSVSETLEIRTRLNTVQSDLASLRAQKKSYDSLIAYSTVNMNIYEVRREEAQNPSFSDEVGGRFNDSLYGIGMGARNFAVWFLGNILYIIIFAAVVCGLVFAIIKLRKIKFSRKPKDEKKNDGE